MLSPKLMTQEISAPELLNNLVCSCNNYCISEDCECISNNQPCTSACVCEPVEDGDMLCLNPYTIEALNGVENDSEN